jgi:hypothetical protein
MYTLHHDAEIRSIDQVEELNSVPAKVKPEEMKLAKQVIATFDAELNLKDYQDEYKAGLRKIIDAKIAGEEVVAPEVQEPPKVVDLMEALRRSLNSVSADKKKPAKAADVKVASSQGSRSPTARSARRRRGGPSGPPVCNARRALAFGENQVVLGRALPDAVRHAGELHGLHAVVEEAAPRTRTRP